MKTYIKIVESKNLSQAAIGLKTTQPTVSRRLKTLESILDLVLIQRSTHQMKMTEEGRLFYFQAKEIVEIWDSLEAQMSGAKLSPKGTLRVQAPHALGIKKLSAILQEYINLYPQVDIEWRLSDRSPDFLSEDLDCAIKVGVIDDPSVVAVKLFDIPRLLVCSKSYAKNIKSLKTPDSLSALSWLAFKNHYTNEISLIHQKKKLKSNLRLTPRLITDNLFVMKEMLLSSMGIGVISKWMIEKELKDGSLVNLCPDWKADDQPVYLIYPQSTLKPAKLQKFIDLMKDNRTLA